MSLIRTAMRLLGLLVLLTSGIAACLAASGQPLTIAIDVGHTIEAPGAISARGVGEYDFNAIFARELAAALVSSHRLRPVLVNADGMIASLEARVDAAIEANADLFLAVHHDSVQSQYLRFWNFRGGRHHYSDDFRGYSVFYSDIGGKPVASAALAGAIGMAVREAGFLPTLHHAEAIEGENRPVMVPEHGVYRFDELRVLRTNPMPAALLEVGVIAHRLEELDVQDPAWRGRFVQAVINGLERFVEEHSAGQ